MKRYEVTSPKMKGRIIFGFEEKNGCLVVVDLSNSGLTEPQWRWVLSNPPSRISELPQCWKTMKWEELVEDITFDMFWKRYDDKARSSKVKTKRQWDKMPVREQAAAYRFISTYFSSIPQGVCKKYATTYLSDQLWNN